MTPWESMVFQQLSGTKFNFVSEHPVNLSDGTLRFFDFYLPDENIFIELDGRQHCDEEQITIDISKEQYVLEHNGFIIRLRNSMISDKSGFNFIWFCIKHVLKHKKSIIWRNNDDIERLLLEFNDKYSKKIQNIAKRKTIRR